MDSKNPRDYLDTALHGTTQEVGRDLEFLLTSNSKKNPMMHPIYFAYCSSVYIAGLVAGNNYLAHAMEKPENTFSYTAPILFAVAGAVMHGLKMYFAHKLCSKKDGCSPDDSIQKGLDPSIYDQNYQDN